MAKLPPRALLRGVLNDAISDREEFLDAHRPRHGQATDDETAALIELTRAQIARYEDLESRLSNPRPLTAADEETLATATQHARIWRVGLQDAWRDTGDKANIRACREDVERLRKVETALGIRPHFITGGAAPEGARMVSIFELMRTMKPETAR